MTVLEAIDQASANQRELEPAHAPQTDKRLTASSS
jgi:hypothetical protein